MNSNTNLNDKKWQDLPPSSSSTSTSRTSGSGPVFIYDFGDSDNNFYVFEDAHRLQHEFRLVSTSIYRAKSEQNSCLPQLPAVLLPEQVQVLLECGHAQLRRVKTAHVGVPSTLEKCQNGKGAQNGHADALRSLARKILLGRQKKGKKRAATTTQSPDDGTQSKAIKLDGQKHAMEGITTKREPNVPDEHAELVVKDEMMAQDELELAQTIRELEERELKKDTGRWMLKFGLPSTSYELVTEPNCFPQTAEHAVKLVVFRDLWRKGFYLSSGAKFGCDYLAYEKPPGEQHSRYMVVCTDANSPLKPLELIGTSRVSTQVRKTILLAVVNPGSVLPYYVEMNWWKGDGGGGVDNNLNAR